MLVTKDTATTKERQGVSTKMVIKQTADPRTKSFDGASVSSTFQKRPAYRYLRQTDGLPPYTELRDVPLEQIKARVKLFNPTGAGTWYVAAYDPDTHIAWGVADIFEAEMGSFSMDKIVAFRGRFQLPIERDLGWEPRSIPEVLEEARSERCSRPDDWYQLEETDHLIVINF